MTTASAEAKVWIVDDDRSIRWVLRQSLEGEGFKTLCFDGADAALRHLPSEQPALVLSDVRMAGTDGMALLRALRERLPEVPVILMTAYSGLDQAVSAFRGGALEFLHKPFDLDEVTRLVRRCLRAPAPPVAAGSPYADGFVGSSAAMQEVFRAIGRLVNSDLGVLITGESGTGKELVAQALHRHGPRAAAPLVVINTAAIPRELLEAELFGHEKGAFTGAVGRRPGHFEQADGGTLFLDEIGDMPPQVQAPLLRVLESGEFYRVGGTAPLRVDVRLIVATHHDLRRRVAEGLFREDLLHRLDVIRIHLPPLRERGEDIEALARHFLHTAAAEAGTAPRALSPAALERLRSLPWPGNVRQLQNLCRRLTAMVPTHEIHPDDLPAEPGDTAAPAPAGAAHWEQALTAWAEAALAGGSRDLLAEAGTHLERALIGAALRHTGGHRRQAAARLGIGRNTLSRKIRELGIDSAKAEDEPPPTA